jgi:hypothetical protein
MDVNGTQFHLIKGQADWNACREELADDGVARVAYDPQSDALTLRPLLALYRPDRPGVPLTAEDRRGAATDQFGNRYWIGADRHSIWWANAEGGRPSLYWMWRPAACPEPSGSFGPVVQQEEAPDHLAGLAVTEHHYLVVGSVERRGLYIFDLHAGPDPQLISLPADIPFEPFDMAPAPDGGVWVLDRRHRRYWGFDRRFRVIGVPGSLVQIAAAEQDDFYAVDGAPIVRPPRFFPTGFPLAAAQPLAIEGLADGSVLVLDEGVAGGASHLWRYQFDTLIGGPSELGDELAFDLGAGIATGWVSISAHDIAFVPSDESSGVLYAVEDNGHQAIAFDLKYGPNLLSLKVRPDYLPLHAYGGRALITERASAGGCLLYDLAAGNNRNRDEMTRWVRLQQIDQPRYATEATLLLDMTSSAPSEPAALDGKTNGCQWHRLFIDGCLPPDTNVEVQTRAADSRDQLELVPFRTEPPLYLRANGSEIPYYRAFSQGDDHSRGRGTWEVLFQAAQGRFIQVRLTLRGNGRATPQLNAVRAYYPRFSYVKRYLPAIYNDEPTSADFTERWLANHEGTLSEIEGKIALVGTLFDPRTAPPDTLDWLAGWWGLLLDPLWGQIQQRRAEAKAGRGCCGPSQRAEKQAPDRRRLFIRFARRLYERRGTPDGIRFALMLLLDPCLEAFLERLKAAALKPDPALRAELARNNLPYPTPSSSELELEDLLYAYLLLPSRPSKIRIVERYQTRGGRALVVGDSSNDAESVSDQELAGRFTVLVPEGLEAAEAAMVRRVVDLERPAHTAFTVRRYFDFFRVGEARLGLESALGAESRFAMLMLNRDYLAGAYLPPAAPQDARDRVILDRDWVGALPVL